MPESFPRLSARTLRFTVGEARAVTVCRRGSRLLYLRALAGDDSRTGLWCLDLPDGDERLIVDPAAATEQLSPAEAARRERARELASGVVAYAADDDGAVATYVENGTLWAVDVGSGERRALVESADVYDPRPDPTGTWVAYVDGADLHVVAADGSGDRAIAVADEPAVGWGRAEFVAAEEMDRFRGFWWSPDGRALLAARVDERAVGLRWITTPVDPSQPARSMRYPVAGSANACVTLHVLGLDGRTVELDWDREAFPYLARVTWAEGRPILLQVQSRDQRRLRTLLADAETGVTTVAFEDSDPVWTELAHGVPGWCGSDIVRIAADDGLPRLFVGAAAVTGDDLYVRQVCGSDDESVLFAARTDEVTQTQVLRWSRHGGVEPLTSSPGVHAATYAAGTVVLSSSSLEHDGVRHVVRRDGAERTLRSDAMRPPFTPTVRMLTLGPRALRAGLVLPREHRPGRQLPVLLDPYGGPHVQRVQAARRLWLEPQWFADQGFAVLVVDGRGTPGRDCAWERAVARDLADGVLDDQAEALAAASELEPDLDLSRVGIRGWSFGGYLAALAVLRRPDVFHAAIAGAPVTDWTLYDTHYTERYLGLPDDEPEVYRRNSLLDDAAGLRRPLLLLHGFADDNVFVAHSLALSRRLTEAGRLHAVVPLSGVSHLSPREDVAAGLLELQVEFLQRSLGAAGDG